MSSAPSPAVSFAAPLPLARLAEHYGGVVDLGAGSLLVAALAPVESASAGQLAPFVARRYLRAARGSLAALLVDASLASLLPSGRRWLHPHAGYALARLLQDLAPPPPPDERALAYIEAGARVDPSASIGVGAVIRSGAVIGPAVASSPTR